MARILNMRNLYLSLFGVTPQFSVEVGSLIAGLATAIGLFLGFRKKKPRETVHAKTAERGSEIRSTLHRLVLSIDNLKIATVAIVRNGGHIGDVTVPKTIQVLESTDFSTWETWSDPRKMEPALLNIHSIVINSANNFYSFKPSQLNGSDHKNWYDTHNIQESTMHLIGINERFGYSIVLFMNYHQEWIPNPTAIKSIDAHLVALKKLYRPTKKWWNLKDAFIT